MFFLSSPSSPNPIALSPEFTQEMSFVADAIVAWLIGFCMYLPNPVNDTTSPFFGKYSHFKSKL
jgi:hypothetical protein